MSINKTLNGKIKIGHILIDDVEQVYKVLEVLNNCVIVSPIRNTENLSCEIMSYEAMDNEGWIIANK